MGGARGGYAAISDAAHAHVEALVNVTCLCEWTKELCLQHLKTYLLVSSYNSFLGSYIVMFVNLSSRVLDFWKRKHDGRRVDGRTASLAGQRPGRRRH